MDKTTIHKVGHLEKDMDAIIQKMTEYEILYKEAIDAVHPNYKKSARNLVHYLALKTFDLASLQEKCKEVGIAGFKNTQVHVAKSIYVNKNVLRSMLGKKPKPIPQNAISRKQSQKLLRHHTTLLFGYKSRKRRTRIMVTMPTEAAEDYTLVQELIKSGTNSARINCAHDGPEVWLKIITNIRKANKRLNKKCKIIMDLSGPKLRTGTIKPGPEVIHVKPKKNLLGQVIDPARLWLGVADCLPDGVEDYKIIPLHVADVKKLESNDILRFKDSRGKACKIQIDKKLGNGFTGQCSDSAYITSGKRIRLKKSNTAQDIKITVGSFQAVERNILLKAGEELILHKDGSPGESTKYDEDGKLIRKAHISCTLPQVFEDIRAGDSIFFDDGKIGGKVISVDDEKLHILIDHAKNNGSKLKADKGINFPNTPISLKGLTDKDKEDLQFVCFQTDAANFSFVNDEADVQEILDTLDKYKSDIGLILKIETKRGLENLPKIILRGMQRYPIGVLIARGDLAVEAGWGSIGFVQEDIRRICKAAHIPSIWATQVLENYAKKGIPSRAELTDALRARKSECIMLNKGPYIVKTVDLLSNILQGKKGVQQSFVDNKSK